MSIFKRNSFNLIVVGYGGQGLLTMAEIIALAAFYQGYETKGTELHGLAQRGGALECHLCFGQKIYSPLVRQAGADLIIGLELLEILRACYYASKRKTVILTNAELFSPYPFEPSKINPQTVLKEIRKMTKDLKLVVANQLIGQETQDTVMINTFMLGCALKDKLLPIKKKFVLQAMAEKIRPIFLEQNKKIFEMAYKIKP